MRAELYFSPLEQSPIASLEVHEALTIDQVLSHPEINAPEWFWDHGCVKIGGHVVPRDLWSKVRLKPSSHSVISFTPVPQQKELSIAIGIVAVVAALAVVSFGIPFLGIAAGSIFANLIAAGIGIGAQLLMSALSPAPAIDNQGAGTTTPVAAGFNGNTPILNDVLPVVFGKIGFAPPPLMPPYTVYDLNTTRVIAVVGLEGRCAISNILINGLTTDKIAGLLIETREGAPYEAPRTIGNETVIEVRTGITLSQFNTKQLVYPNDPLVNQPVDSLDIPQWHSSKTSGVSDDFTLRFFAPSGFVNTQTVTDKVTVPIRIRIRKKGDSVWRNIPEIHLQDINPNNGGKRAEVKFAFSKSPAGKLIGRNDAWPIWSLTNSAGRGASYRYDADSYFSQTLDANYYSDTGNSGLATGATGPTTGAITYSESSVHAAGFEGWRSFDSLSSTYWISAVGDAAAYLQVDFGSATTIKSYSLVGFTNATGGSANPRKWRVLGSADGTTWIDIDGVDISNSPEATYGVICNISNSANYRYYRWSFGNPTVYGFSQWAIRALRIYNTDAVCSSLSVESGSANVGMAIVHSSATTEARCKNANLNKNGVTFYLDPEQWPLGEYEAQYMRGMSFPSAHLDPRSYAISNASATNGFFGTTVDASGNICAAYGYYFRSDLQLELIQTHQAIAPFNPQGLCYIAISAPNIQINSIYAEFTRYAPSYNNGVWSDSPSSETPTTNPVALYRQLLLGGSNAQPVPGEIIDEDELAAWYQTCVAKGYEVNAVLQGARVSEALQLIASAGYASPRMSATWGIVEDKDTTALPVSYAITPLNSQDRGTQIVTPILPHAIHATFADETDSYAQNTIDVFRNGFDVTNATLYETINYPGLTSLAKVTARAKFDLLQLSVRQAKYQRTLGLEGMALKRGMLVALNDDVLDGNQFAGWISSVQVSAGLVVSVTLENIIPWSQSGTLEANQDIASLADAMNPTQAMAVAIRVPNASMVVRLVSNVTDSNKCTFTSPFADDGSVVAGLLVLAGPMGNTHKRVKISNVMPQGFETFTVEMVDEAPQLYI